MSIILIIMSFCLIENAVYPEYLIDNGFTESILLQLLFHDCSDFNWTIPDTCSTSIFYSYLHPFLKTSEKTKDCSKCCIGQLYCKIDPYMSVRNFRPDNAFRFVERLVNRSKPVASDSQTGESDSEAVMVPNSISATSVDASTIDTCYPPYIGTCNSNWAPDDEHTSRNQQVQSLRNAIRRERRKMRKIESLKRNKSAELRIVRRSVEKKVNKINELSQKLATITAELETAYIMLDNSKKKEQKMSQDLRSVLEDFQFSEHVIEDLQAENLELKKVISSAQRHEHVKSQEQPITRFDTKQGNHNSLPIRRLYLQIKFQYLKYLYW